jgi:AraC-like DNA-binding protein
VLSFMRTEPGPAREPDPVAELIRRFAASRGVEAGTGTRIDEIWRRLAGRGDPSPGLSFAAWTAPAAVGGPLVPLLSNSPDLRSLLAQLERFHPLFGQDRIILRTRGARASLVLVAESGGPALPDTVDACFGLLSRVARDLTRPDRPTDRVLLRRPAPADPARYLDVFGTVVFGAGQDCCEFDVAALDTPIRTADPAMLALLAPYADRRVAERAGPWTAAATRVLDAAPSHRLPDIARSLAVSTRSLQQHLRAEGTTYSILADLRRRERALAMLVEGDELVTTIAVRLGFAGPAALTRAVRRWTGSSPSRYRDDHRPPGITRGS